MLKEFENWLLNNNYRPTTAFDLITDLPPLLIIKEELKDCVAKKAILCLIWPKTLLLFYLNMKLMVKNQVMVKEAILQLDKP